MKRLGLCLSVISLISIGACDESSDQGSNIPTPIPEKTVAEKIADMESSGTLPKLDRSESITGPDTNTDGVRDDVEQYLKRQAYNGPQLEAALQMARAVQSMLSVDLTDSVKLEQTASQGMLAANCVIERFPGVAPDSRDSPLITIEKVTVNTRQRFDAYVAYNAALDGSTSSVPRESTCE